MYVLRETEFKKSSGGVLIIILIANDNQIFRSFLAEN